MNRDVIATLIDADSTGQPIKNALMCLGDDSIDLEQKYQKLELICRVDAGYFDAAKIVLATSQLEPYEAGTWLKVLVKGFKEEKKTLNFEMGVLVGIFQALNWMRQNNTYFAKRKNKLPGPAMIQYEKEFQEQLPEMIINTTEGRIDSKYEPLLSKVIKDSVGKPGWDGTLSCCLGMLESIASVVISEDAVKNPLNIGPHGYLVIDQLCYAAFGQIRPGSRLQLISSIRSNGAIAIPDDA